MTEKGFCVKFRLGLKALQTLNILMKASSDMNAGSGYVYIIIVKATDAADITEAHNLHSV